MFFNLLDGLAYDLEPMASGARQHYKSGSALFTPDKHKTILHKGVLCLFGGLACDLEGVGAGARQH
ncbi:hypothetical protein ABE26_07100 [Cytobacillus firmus]|nr:hypothetical protein [Cytobacillus firmus]